MKSFKYVEGWLQVTEPGVEGPIDPGYGRPGGPTDPGFGNRPPVDPGYGRPGWGGPTDPGWGGGPPLHPGGGPIKPPGRPILPSNPIYTPPPAHPWLPGRWEILDPGFGKPPILGFIPVDPGWGISVSPPAGGGKPPGGIWVPIDPDFGKPVGPCPPVGGKPHPPLWAWLPDRPAMPGGGEGTKATVTLYPTTATAPVTGGSGSVNPTLTTPGTWEVSAASVPDWVTVTPMGPQTVDVNILWTATKNTTGLVRQASIKVNDATLTINQGVS